QVVRRHELARWVWGWCNVSYPCRAIFDRRCLRSARSPSALTLFTGNRILSRRNSWLRRIVVWGGPLLMIAVLVVAGFFYWILTTTSGARWALVTATRSLDGAVSQVSGNVWDGLRVGKLTLPLPDMDIDVTDAYLQVQWDDLLRRNLHIQDLSVGRLAVALRSSEQETESSGDFTMPTLPI